MEDSVDDSLSVLLLDKLEEIFQETLRADDPRIKDEVQQVREICELWGYLWCLVRQKSTAEEMVSKHNLGFLHAYCESCRDALVAASLAFHGCYKQAKEVLRNCAELIVLACFFGKNPKEYSKWLKDPGYHIPWRELVSRAKLGDFSQEMVALYSNLSQAVHSSNLAVETRRMTCDESHTCAMVRILTLELDYDQFVEFAEYFVQAFELLGSFVVNKFPRILEYPNEALCDFIDEESLKRLRRIYGRREDTS